MSTHELTATAREHRELQAQIKALEEQADALKQKMISELDAQQAEAIKAGEYTIRYSMYDTRRVDTNAIKAAGLYEQYSKVTTVIRFQVA